MTIVIFIEVEPMKMQYMDHTKKRMYQIDHPLFSLNIVLSPLFLVLWIRDGGKDFRDG